MEVNLWYGDGFSGRQYTLQIGNEYVFLMMGLGGEDEEKSARQKAQELLIRANIDIDLSTIPFKWDGTL